VRTTLNLDPSAFEAARSKAAHEDISLGEAVSKLILQAVEPRQGKSLRRAKAVFKSKGGIYSAAQVEASLDDE
jgi:hypothetical protein